jgi:hypothetical protein
VSLPVVMLCVEGRLSDFFGLRVFRFRVPGRRVWERDGMLPRFDVVPFALLKRMIISRH